MTAPCPIAVEGVSAPLDLTTPTPVSTSLVLTDSTRARLEALGEPSYAEAVRIVVELGREIHAVREADLPGLPPLPCPRSANGAQC
ncbi:hypothetical protein [Allokutzneria sp. NRRL B-24872]|uniref:hypothetical protein n=1 Tax=Allokutzneria sp. NRRL B-24872 TaxID=1137961 RepID=UPI000A36B7E4|nr:hypothetical protein [Allokutzneria sp. NRRL B-24872]